MDGKAAFANILGQEGVDVVFRFPNNILIDACAAAGIRPIISRMERTAVNMADAYSRVNNGNKNGVCIVQGGPGIENAFSGVAQAYADSSPLLMIPGHPGTKRHGMSSDFDASRNYQGVTKWADYVNYTERISEMMRRAYTQLRTGRPYPVLLEMPNDVLSGEISEEQFHYKAQEKRRSAGDPRDQIVPFYAATTPRGYIGWGNSTQLGTGLGYAMGAKVAFPDKTCVNLMGDVAVGMAGTDFETAAREKLGIITVIVNNGAMGGYEKNIPVAVERYGSKYVTGEYARMDESLGAYAEKITDPGEVGPAIERAKEISATGQPCVLSTMRTGDNHA